MPIKTDSLNRKLYELLKVRGYNPVPKDSEGQTTPVPDDAEVFKFTFKKDDKDVGEVWITIDSSQNLVVYYDDDVSDSDQENTSGTGFSNSWTGFIQNLKNWAQRRQLSFELKNKNHLSSDMAQRSHMKKQEQIAEAKKYPKGKGCKCTGNKASPKCPIHGPIDGPNGEGKAAADKKKAVEEGMGLDGAEPYTLGAPIDKKNVYQVHRTANDVRDYKNMGKFVHDGGTTHSLDDAKRRKAFLLKNAPPGVRGKIVKVPRQSLAGPKGMLPEAYYPMGKKASYNDSVPSVKIVLQHSRQIEEGEQRFRNVAKIFLENEAGERILAPTTRPGIARIYARHIAEGGMPHDERWNHVTALVEEYSKMAGFVRATRNGTFNESAQQLVQEGINHYQSLRETLGKMTGHRGYNAYFESWTPTLMETDGDDSSLTELFVQENLDPRIESVMPILSKLHKKVNEIKEVSELAEWADKVEDSCSTDSTTQSVSQPLNEYLIAPGAKASDILLLNLFTDLLGNDRISLHYPDWNRDSDWKNAEKKYVPIATKLSEMIKKYRNRKLSEEDVSTLENTWYDGSDIYDDMDVESLTEYYDMQIDAVIEVLENINIRAVKEDESLTSNNPVGIPESELTDSYVASPDRWSGPAGDAEETAKLTKRAKYAAAKAGVSFDEGNRELTNAKYRQWYAKQKKKNKTIEEENTPLTGKEDYMAKRKALQQMQMDPKTSKNRDLVLKMMKRKADLEKEAEHAGYALAEDEVEENANPVTDPTAMKVKELSNKFFKGKPYSSARIANGTMHRISYIINGMLPSGNDYHHASAADITPEDKAAMKGIKTKFLRYMKQNGIPDGTVDLKFHIVSFLYASVRTKIKGSKDKVAEGRMAEADMVMQDLINGEREIYDVMNNPQGPEEEYVAKILQDLYHDVAIEHHFHEDDDFEKIEQYMMMELEKTYGHAEDDEHNTQDPYDQDDPAPMEESLDDIKKLSGL